MNERLKKSDVKPACCAQSSRTLDMNIEAMAPMNSSNMEIVK